MNFAELLGKLNKEAFMHNMVVMGGILSMTIGLISVVFLLTYLKRWKWLYKNWLTSLDHKKIGVMYIVVSTLMLVRGVIDAAIMRSHTALSSGNSNGFLESDHFQQMFSAHGTIMIFFVAMGLMFGLINLIMPLQIGARDVAFPFLNNLSFWLFFAGMALINTSLAIGEFSAAGWLAYPPLAELQYSPGVGIDYWLWSIQISGIGSLLSGINFIVTILKERAPGMSLMKMPIFTWSVLSNMVLLVIVFPILTATLALLSLDRIFGMHFFTSNAGGDPMMYINLIWAWGHPEVYILILPAFGIYSEIVATFSRKKLFGYTSMVAALISISVLSFLVWLHHFFTMGAGPNVNAFFGIMTMIIAIPTGVKIFNWLFTMFRGRIDFKTPMIWFMAFVFVFTIGGMTGVLMSVPAIDFQVHNSLFLVAHFHNTIIGGVVFGYIAGFIYWFPKIFGFKLSEKIGLLSQSCWIIGFLLTFMPLYILGFMGATRRLDHYDPSLGWQGLFVVSAIGVFIILLGILLQVAQVVYSIWNRKSLRDKSGDPWNGRTIEWATPSPAPFYNFAIIPTITRRDEFWERKNSHKKSSTKLKYADIVLPKNSGMGIVIGALAFLACFSIVWHIWWLAIIAIIMSIVSIVIRGNQLETEYTIPAKKVEELDKNNPWKELMA